jgi:hypothetical protein
MQTVYSATRTITASAKQTLMKVCAQAADKRTDEMRTGGRIMGIETIKWGLVATIIWLGIYQLFNIINGTPLF